MTQFIKRVALFFLFSVTFLAMILSVVILLNRTFARKCVLRNDTKTVIMGDSHTMWSIDDTKLRGVQNASLNAEGYIYTHAKLKYLIRHNHAINKLYLGFSYHNLSGYYDDYLFGKQALLFFFRYIDVLGFEDYLTLFAQNPKNIASMTSILLREGIWSLVDGRCAFLGTFPSETMLQTFNGEKARKRIMEQYYKNNAVVPCSELNVEYFAKILDLCKENGIEVVALSTPLQKEYRSLIPKEYIEKYDAFIRQYHLAVYDFKGFELPDSCYLPDGDHVNYNGAMATTEHFRAYLALENK